MKILATTNKGMEDISADEIESLTGSKVSLKNGFMLFDLDNYESVFELCYLARSLTKVVVLFDNFSFKEIPANEIKNRIKDYNLKDFIEGQRFTVQGEREGIHSFNSAEVGDEIIKTILSLNDSTIPDRKNPQTIFYFHIFDNEFYFGLDFCGEDLGRRDYRIFLSSQSIKGNTAFALIKLSEYNKKETFIDPFCREGTIPIEAALYASKKSPHFYRKEKFAFRLLKKFADFDFETFFKKLDSSAKEDPLKIYAIDDNFRSIQASRKNAMIAGLRNFEFSRQDIQWLDSKFKKNELDIICTFPLQYSKTKDSKKIDKIYKHLFYQAEYLLNKKGRIVLLMKTIPEQVIKLWEEYKFTKSHERIIMQGKEDWRVIILRASSKNP